MRKFQTIPKNRTEKHLSQISNIKTYTLDNGFSGKPFEGTKEEWFDWAIRRMEGKLQISRETNEGRVHLHNNCWYEFSYGVGA